MTFESDEEGSETLAPAVPGETFELTDPAFGRLVVYRDGDTRPGEAPVLLIHSVNAAASAFEMRPLYQRLAKERPTYTFDLPGFGLSDRTARLYTPRLMTDAVHAVVEAIGERHPDMPVDAVALSLSSEFLARAATERPDAFRTVALISPTGLDRRGRRDGPPETTKGSAVVRSIVTCGLWDDLLFSWLTRPRVVRYFLEKAFGRPGVDEGLQRYAVDTAQEPGAKHAPFSFLSGYLFSADITRVYEALDRPVFMVHGVRGDFVDFTGAEPMRARGWEIQEYPTGALP
ncbi:MAG: alpha/beta fold hydrolase, partial [Myxococcota bacterium]